MPPNDKLTRVESPFYCPCGAGNLQRHDLEKLFQVVGTENNPSDPTPSLWVIHIQARLLRALKNDSEATKRYIGLIRQIKAGNLSEEREQKVRRQMDEIEAQAFPPDSCKYCQQPESSESKLSRCSRCKTRFYCKKECQLADWAVHKKTCQKIQQPHLANAQAMQRQFGPENFWAPSEEHVREVQETVNVKVCIQHVERFWVQVDTVLEWPKFVGRVDNYLVSTPQHGLKYNDRILFEWDNVYDIEFPMTWKSILYTERG